MSDLTQQEVEEWLKKEFPEFEDAFGRGSPAVIARFVLEEVKKAREESDLFWDSLVKEQGRIIDSYRDEMIVGRQKVEKLRAGLEGLAKRGCRHDTMPTIGGRIKSFSDYSGWCEYLKSMDSRVKEEANRILEETK